MALMPTRENGPAARSFAADAYDCIMVSPLRTDSLPLVSKIYWPQNADDAIMDAP